MNLKGEYTFSSTAEEVYDRLLDPDVLRECMPGCEALEKVGENRFEISFGVPIPAVSGTYDGTIEVVDPIRPSSFTMNIDAKGTGGFVRAEARLEIEPQGPSALVRYEADMHIGGAAASVGQRVITGMSRRQIAQMMMRLDRKKKLGLMARAKEWVARVFGGRQAESD